MEDLDLNKEMSVTSQCTSQDDEVNHLLESLSAESKSLVKVLTKIISTQLSDKLANITRELSKKDQQIKTLTNEVKCLQDKVHDLEININSVDQYERRDTIILSGPSVPQEMVTENTTNVVINTIKDNLKLNLKRN